MPSYSYRAVDTEAACEVCSEHFNVFQRMSEEAVTHCPECELPVRRLIVRSQAMTNRRYHTKKMLSDGNLKRLGFQKLVKESSGKYVDVLKD